MNHTLFTFTQALIKDAGQLTLQYRQRLNELIVDHKNDKDLVSEADKAVEDLIRNKIHEKYPDHQFFGEESGQTTTDSPYRWIVDPIDGTTSFVHGQHFFSVSIALEINGVIEIGAVFAPTLNELFLAHRGHGATLNGIPIKPSTRAQLSHAVMATGFACVRAGLEETNLPVFNALLPQIRDVRRMGSAAIDLCYVACGRLEGFWEIKLNLYDIAAGWLILEEAGGRVTDYNLSLKNLPGEMLATNGLIHEEASEAILKAQ